MRRAIWNGEVIASVEEGKYEVVEGNIYFPPESVKKQYLSPSTKTSHCPWKGDASYYNIEVRGETNSDAAWYYAAPSDEAAKIKDHVAFWKGVIVE